MIGRRLVAVAAAIVLGAGFARMVLGHEGTARRRRPLDDRTRKALPPVGTGGTIGARGVALRAGMTRLTESRGLEMSEQNPQFESVDGATDAATGGSYSGNGTQPEDSAVAVSDAQTPPEAEAIGQEPETSEAVAAETDAAVEAAAEASDQPAPEAAAEASGTQPEAEIDADTQPEAEIDADTQPEAAGSAADDDGTAFLAALTRAMQTTAGTERAKIADDTAGRREAHIAAIHARRESEASRIRELADEDRKTIDAWADAERQHIQLEHERRTQALQRDLETSLATHSSKIEAEIGRVEEAIASYRAEVDTFFTTLERETDPVAIAQQAGRRPAFPDLEAAGAADADAGAAANDPAIGVMDPQSANTGPWPSWTQTPAATAPTEAPVDEETPVADGATPEPAVLSAVAGGEEAGGTIVQSMPVSRPMSWLRRERESNEGAARDK